MLLELAGKELRCECGLRDDTLLWVEGELLAWWDHVAELLHSDGVHGWVHWWTGGEALHDGRLDG